MVRKSINSFTGMVSGAGLFLRTAAVLGREVGVGPKARVNPVCVLSTLMQNVDLKLIFSLRTVCVSCRSNIYINISTERNQQRWVSMGKLCKRGCGPFADLL